MQYSGAIFFPQDTNLVPGQGNIDGVPGQPSLAPVDTYPVTLRTIGEVPRTVAT